MDQTLYLKEMFQPQIFQMDIPKQPTQVAYKQIFRIALPIFKISIKIVLILIQLLI